MAARGGPQTISADGVIGTSGRAFRVYAISITSDGTAAGPLFYNGVSAGGTLYLTGTGTINKAVLVPDIPEAGLLFPAGLFVDIDAHTTSLTVWGDQGG